jgi:hypothetical protein
VDANIPLDSINYCCFPNSPYLDITSLLPKLAAILGELTADTFNGSSLVVLISKSWFLLRSAILLSLLNGGLKSFVPRNLLVLLTKFL